MKQRIILLIVALAFVSGINAQNVLNAKTPQEVGKANMIKNDKGEMEEENIDPIEYDYVDERDIMWSTTVWEVVDLSEKINLAYYFPLDTMNAAKNHRSLFDALMSGILKGEITEVYSDDYFTAKKSIKDVRESLSRIDTLPIGVEQFNAGERVSPEYIVKTSLTSRDITQYKFKGLWYFDKRNGEMKYRLLGMAPVSPDVNELDAEEPDMVELFWVWYPNTRKIMNKIHVFNPGNTAFSLSYDNLLNSRKFIGVIYKEDNIYGDRKISDYIKENAMFQLLEADKIKNKIRNFEMDLWNY